MLPNSSDFLCISNGLISPYSDMFYLSSAPYNITRRSKSSFLICDNDTEENKVKIFDMDVSGEKHMHLDFENFNATRWDSFDDYVLMINSEGDIVYINLNNKCIDLVKKQHPGESVCVLHSETDFITAGGYVKALDKDQSERIIKVWGVDHQEKLFCKSRFSTGHTKPIQFAMMMNRNIVATLSKDKSIRLSDINFQATTRVIYTPTEEPLSACQLNYSSLIYGGNKPYLNIVDTRTRKQIRQKVLLNEPLTQVTKIVRFSQSQLMLCNVNHLMLLDLKTMTVRQKKQVQGETIWGFKVLDQKHFVIGNRGKFIQIWQVSN